MTAPAPKKPRAPRKPPPFRLTMPEVPESSILSACLQLLQYDMRVAWAARLNTGAAKFDRGDGTAQLVRFGFEGLSDIVGQMKDGRFLAIECKNRIGRLRPMQTAFLLHVQKHNGVAGVARSVDDVLAILGGWRFDPEAPK